MLKVIQIDLNFILTVWNIEQRSIIHIQQQSNQQNQLDILRRRIELNLFNIMVANYINGRDINDFYFGLQQNVLIYEQDRYQHIVKVLMSLILNLPNFI
ncbi:hypothetical protein pb186bvf_009866 [Paramecium bursaria]